MNETENFTIAEDRLRWIIQRHNDDQCCPEQFSRFGPTQAVYRPNVHEAFHFNSRADAERTLEVLRYEQPRRGSTLPYIIEFTLP